MEDAEGKTGSIISRFKLKRNSKLATAEPARLIPGWDYETYREYLLALSRGREFLLPIEDYPSRLELSEPWHEAFNQIRANSHEGWVLIGYQAGQRRLVIPRVAEKGLSHSVPHAIMSAGLEKARTKTGITDLIGDAHSHPRTSTDLSWNILSVLNNEKAAFSLADIYGFLDDLSKQRPSDPKISVMFVAEGDENIAAFATKRSLELVRNNFSGTLYEEFAKKWYERYGWRFEGNEPTSQGGGELAEPDRAGAPNLWQINKGIAFEYQLALYGGFKNRSLLRDRPAKNAFMTPNTVYK